MFTVDARTFGTISLLLTLLGNSALHAETVLIDDFGDGNDAGWLHSTNNVPENGATWTVDQGTYAMSTNEPVRVGDQGHVLSFWEESLQSQFQNGYWRTKVQANTAGTSAGIVLRSSNGSIHNGYLLTGSGHAPNFNIWRCNGSSVDDCVLLGEISQPFRANAPWWFEAGFVDDTLSLKVWRDGDEEPAAPQFQRRDPSPLGPGYFGIGSGISGAWQNRATNSSIFGPVTFTPVPEPSILAMATVAGLALLRVRKRRLC